MDAMTPLRFRPIFKDHIWGGRKLAELFPSAPAEGPVAEAWLLSDEGKNASVVADGPFAGWTLRQLMTEHGDHLLGRAGANRQRFPLLIKFLDAAQNLSVQVHPTDELALHVGPDQRGKTEAWVILDAEPGAKLYAGLKAGVDETRLRRAVADGTTADCLHSYEVHPGDCVFLPAGTVHAIGAGLRLFEVQQTSDITYRLFDWNRVDAKTGRPRDLHIEESIRCTNFAAGPCDPVQPSRDGARECLVTCDYFRLWRHRSAQRFTVGAPDECRVVVGVVGNAVLIHAGREHRLNVGDALLLPPEVGVCEVLPNENVTLLESGL